MSARSKEFLQLLLENVIVVPTTNDQKNFFSVSKPIKWDAVFFATGAFRWRLRVRVN